jgi:hypothetical protein
MPETHFQAAASARAQSRLDSWASKTRLRKELIAPALLTTAALPKIAQAFDIPQPPTLTADHDRKAANAIDPQCLAGQLHLAMHSAFIGSECGNDQLQRGVSRRVRRRRHALLCAVIVGWTTMRASGSARDVAS